MSDKKDVLAKLSLAPGERVGLFTVGAIGDVHMAAKVLNRSGLVLEIEPGASMYEVKLFASRRTRASRTISIKRESPL